MNIIIILIILGVVIIGLVVSKFIQTDPPLKIKKQSHVVLIGNNLGSRMMNYGHFETEMHLRYPDDSLFIRNMSDPGDTPGFRPRAARDSPWAFPGAKKFFLDTQLATESGSKGFFPSPDEWLEQLKADVIIAFFGYSESFRGEKRLQEYKAELDAFIKHTLNQKYNGERAPQLV